MSYAVMLNDTRRIHVYGPFASHGDAADFAAFLTAEVDPASVIDLRSPTDELLSFWRHLRGPDEEVPF